MSRGPCSTAIPSVRRFLSIHQLPHVSQEVFRLLYAGKVQVSGTGTGAVTGEAPCAARQGHGPPDPVEVPGIRPGEWAPERLEASGVSFGQRPFLAAGLMHTAASRIAPDRELWPDEASVTACPCR